VLQYAVYRLLRVIDQIVLVTNLQIRSLFKNALKYLTLFKYGVITPLNALERVIYLWDFLMIVVKVPHARFPRLVTRYRLSNNIPPLQVYTVTEFQGAISIIRQLIQPYQLGSKYIVLCFRSVNNPINKTLALLKVTEVQGAVKKLLRIASPIRRPKKVA